MNNDNTGRRNKKNESKEGAPIQKMLILSIGVKLLF